MFVIFITVSKYVPKYIYSFQHCERTGHTVNFLSTCISLITPLQYVNVFIFVIKNDLIK